MAAAAAATHAPVAHHAPHHYAHAAGHAGASTVHFDKTTKIGFAICGVLLVVTLIVVFSTHSKHKAETEAEQAYKASLVDLQTKLEAFNLASDSDCQLLIRLADEKSSLWKGSEIESVVSRLQSRAQQNIENGRDRRTITDRFDGIEKQLANPGSLTPDQMKEILVALEEIASRASIVDDAFQKKVEATKKSAAHINAQRLLASAQETAAKNDSNPRLALRASISAEDAIYAPLNEAHHNKDQTEIQFFEPIYKEAVGLTDKLSIDVFGTRSGANEGTIPLKDMLSGDNAKNWNPTNVKGFSWRVDGGVMQIVGPDVGTNQQAILAIGDREQWRNVVLEMEFTVEKGWFELYFRLGKGVNVNTPVYRVNTEGDQAAFEAGKNYGLVASVLGNKFIVRMTGDEGAELKNEELTWNRTRKGAIGLLIPPGARLKVTSFKVRELL